MADAQPITQSDTLLWWQRGIIYQIYPRSFQDTNDDGVGDLRGILERLDYLQQLGVDAIWLSPIFPSPMADFGYDVADYTGIDPLFGTLDDFDRLLAAAHSRGLKILLDLVPNHTSDQHPWFLESRASRDNPKRDWYIWRDPDADGTPPNNWVSMFGGPAWSYDEQTGQYYLHQFAKEQPELNYRNPAVLAAMLDVMRFWLDRGVDGFRVDVIWLLMKDAMLRDEPPSPTWDGTGPLSNSLDHIYTQNLPETHDLIRRMRAVLDSYPERVMIGEIYLSNEQLVRYYGANNDECHLPFNFQLVLLPQWTAEAVRAAVEAYEAALPHGAWPNWVLGNHDQHRLASRIGEAQARVAIMLLLTLRGTPTTYNGEELGMTDGTIPPDKVKDPPAVLQPEHAAQWGRDPERTPMQWDASPNAGFTRPEVEPWLPIAASVEQINVAGEEADPHSMLHLYRALAHGRRATRALQSGAYSTVTSSHPDVYSYLRSDGAERWLVVLNFGSDGHQLDYKDVGKEGTIRISTSLKRDGRVELDKLTLYAHEGLVIQVIG